MNAQRRKEMMATTAQDQRRDTPPSGHEFVPRGEIKAGDQVWDEIDQDWAKVGTAEIGDDAEGYYAISRKS